MPTPAIKQLEFIDAAGYSTDYPLGQELLRYINSKASLPVFMTVTFVSDGMLFNDLMRHYHHLPDTIEDVDALAKTVSGAAHEKVKALAGSGYTVTVLDGGLTPDGAAHRWDTTLGDDLSVVLTDSISFAILNREKKYDGAEGLVPVVSLIAHRPLPDEPIEAEEVTSKDTEDSPE